MSSKPFAAAAEQNREDILSVLCEVFSHAEHILEIGSGTGQHAVYFAQALRHLTWQASDKSNMLDGIQQWLDEAALDNTPKAIDLDVNSIWPAETYDAVFAANIIHIMHWSDVEALFKGLSTSLGKQGIFCVYGPFNKDGKYTSDSNQQFDHWLKNRDPQSGIKDIAQLDALARLNQLQPFKSWEMPANNKILSWKK